MAKAGDKSSTSDKVSTKKASIAKADEEIAGLFKPKTRKTRSTDDPQVKRAQQRAVRNAVEKFEAGHRAPRMMSISLREKTERRKKTKWRVRLDRERKQRKRLFETAPAGGKQPRVALRAWWAAVSKVLGGIQNVTDLDDLLYGLFAVLAEQAAYLAVGQIPDPIKRVGGKGRKAPGPGEISDIRWAVTYIRAVRDGLVRGLKPPLVVRGRRKSSPDAVAIAVVCRLYKLSDEHIVRTWCRIYKPFPYPDAWTVSSLRNRVADAARRYRLECTNGGIR